MKVKSVVRTINVELSVWEAQVIAELMQHIGGCGAVRDFTDELGDSLAKEIGYRTGVPRKFVNKDKDAYNGVWVYDVLREDHESV